MNKSCFVIDTNILVSRLLFPQSIPAQAVKLAIKKGTVLVSDETLQEKVRSLSIPELESLGEALLDFQNISDLESWFNNQKFS
jgi:predicted nucleic acid-binding protein